MILSDIAEYVTERVNSDKITLNQYVTTDSLLQNKRGRQTAQNLPPIPCVLTSYSQGDILISNIRPYLKKIWFADSNGGCSTDVLVFRAKKGHSSNFLFALLMQDAFFSYMMQGSKGSKMPRGDKNQIMHYKVPTFSSFEEENIGNIIVNIERKIALNRQINDNLEAMARQLYDYWFVQFDFSDENGRPYKSSGGKMVWNEKLKQNIPMGWIVEDISKIADVYNGATPSTKEEQNYGGNIVWITPKDLSDQKSKFVYYGERNITQKGYDSCSTHMLPIGTVLMSSRAPIGLLSIAKSELCTNQGFKSFVSKKETLGSYLYYYILLHIKQIEQLGTGTTFKEISRDDVMTYPILVPKEELLNKWAEFVFPIDNRQFEIQQENNKLTKQRDELLPLLMNGQATVNSD